MGENWNNNSHSRTSLLTQSVSKRAAYLFLRTCSAKQGLLKCISRRPGVWPMFQ